MLVSFDMYCKNDLFLYRNLFYAALMATAFEGNREELVHDGTGRVVVDETTGHHEHVGIVVLTNQLANPGFQHTPARTPWCLLSVMEMPWPLPQMAMPG